MIYLPNNSVHMTAAIVGQLAGAFYGKSGIPAGWLDRLHLADEIRAIGDALWTLRRDLPLNGPDQRANDAR